MSRPGKLFIIRKENIDIFRTKDINTRINMKLNNEFSKNNKKGEGQGNLIPCPEDSIWGKYIPCERKLSSEEWKFYSREFPEKDYYAALNHKNTAESCLQLAESHSMHNDNLTALSYVRYSMIYAARTLLALNENPKDMNLDVMTRFERNYIQTGIVYPNNFSYWSELDSLLNMLAYDANFEVSEDEISEALGRAFSFMKDVDEVLLGCVCKFEEDEEELA